jgi:hypothetical protein
VDEGAVRVVANPDPFEGATVIAKCGVRHSAQANIDRFSGDMPAGSLRVSSRGAVATDDIHIATPKMIRDSNEESRESFGGTPRSTGAPVAEQLRKAVDAGAPKATASIEESNASAFSDIGSDKIDYTRAAGCAPFAFGLLRLGWLVTGEHQPLTHLNRTCNAKAIESKKLRQRNIICTCDAREGLAWSDIDHPGFRYAESLTRTKRGVQPHRVGARKITHAHAIASSDLG